MRWSTRARTSRSVHGVGAVICSGEMPATKVAKAALAKSRSVSNCPRTSGSVFIARKHCSKPLTRPDAVTHAPLPAPSLLRTPPARPPALTPPRVTAPAPVPCHPPRAGQFAAAEAPSQWRGLHPRPSGFAPGRPLTASLPGKIRRLPEGHVGESRFTQPRWATSRPSSHEEGLLRHRGSGGQRIDLDWLQRSAWFPPDCDRPPGHRDRPPRPGGRSRARITGTAARSGSRPQSGGWAVHHHDRQKWSVPAAIAA